MTLRKALLLWMLLLLPAALSATETDPDPAIASAIRSHFEQVLYQLDPVTQTHWALRIYRTRGDARYESSIFSSALLIERNFLRDVDGWADPAYRRGREAQLMMRFEGEGRKNRRRRKFFDEHRDELYKLNLLSELHRLTEWRFLDDRASAAAVEAREILDGGKLADFLLEGELMRTYAAQAINYIDYLRELGLADRRAEWVDAFRHAYPDGEDSLMRTMEFKDKIYGLTHIVLADSGYFQRELDASGVAWILDYFEKRLDRILEETKPDIIAEVGLCFLLAGRDGDPALDRCREAVAAAFDARLGMIPSVSGKTDLRKGEHRNVLACLLLDWPGRLYPGPDLSAWEPASRLLAP